MITSSLLHHVHFLLLHHMPYAIVPPAMSQPIGEQASPAATTPTIIITHPSPTSSPPPTISPPNGPDLPPFSESDLPSPTTEYDPPPAYAEFPPDGTASSSTGTTTTTTTTATATAVDPEIAREAERETFLQNIRACLEHSPPEESLPILIWLLERSPTYGNFCAQKANQIASQFNGGKEPLLEFEYPDHAEQ